MSVHRHISHKCVVTVNITGNSIHTYDTYTKYLGLWYHRHLNHLQLDLDTYHQRLFQTVRCTTHHPAKPTTDTNNFHAVVSIIIIAINNSHLVKPWMDLPTIRLLSRVQPLPTTYGTNNAINNTAKLLERVMVYEITPLNTPVIIVYDSTVVYSQHLVLIGTTYTNRKHTRIVFQAINRMLAQQLEATIPTTLQSTKIRH